MLANESMIQNEDEILDGFLHHKNAMFCWGHKNTMCSAVIVEYGSFFILRADQQSSQNVRRTFLRRNIRIVCFFEFEARKFHSPKYKKHFLEKIWELFKLRTREFHFPKYKKHFKSAFFFYFGEVRKLLPEI